MKRLLIALILVAPSAFAAEEQPSKGVTFTEAQKQAIVESNIPPQVKQQILEKIYSDQELSAEELALLAEQELLPSEEVGLLELVGRLINIQSFGQGMAGCFLSSTGINTKPNRSELLLAAVKALKFDQLKVTVKQTEGMLSDFIKQEFFNAAIDGLMLDHAKKRIDKHTLSQLNINLDRSLEHEAFQKALTKEEYALLTGNGEKVNIAYLLSLFGFIEDRFDLEGLNQAFDSLALGKEVETHVLLNCINMDLILKGFGFKEEELPSTDALRGYLYFHFIASPKEYSDYTNHMAEYYREVTSRETRTQSNTANEDSAAEQEPSNAPHSNN